MPHRSQVVSLPLRWWRAHRRVRPIAARCLGGSRLRNGHEPDVHAHRSENRPPRSPMRTEHSVCRRLRSMPGIGAVAALTFRSAGDHPARLTSSKKVGPSVGLTPSRSQSGERDVSGGITKACDVNLRRALCEAVTVMMHCGRSRSSQGRGCDDVVVRTVADPHRARQ